MYNNDLYAFTDGWLGYCNSMFRNPLNFNPEIFISLRMHLDIFFDRNSSYVVTHEKFYDKNNQTGKKTQIIIKTGFNRFLIMQHPQARFFVGFQKHSNAKINILRHANYIGEIKYQAICYKKLKQNARRLD